MEPGRDTVRLADNTGGVEVEEGVIVAMPSPVTTDVAGSEVEGDAVYAKGTAP